MSEWKMSSPPPPHGSKRSAASGIICALTEKSNILHSLLILITYLLRNLLRFGSIKYGKYRGKGKGNGALETGEALTPDLQIRRSRYVLSTRPHTPPQEEEEVITNDFFSL